MKNLDGKTALVTGAAGGIGLGIAKALARAGMNIAVTDIKKGQLTVAEDELKEITDKVLALEADSTDQQSLANAGRQNSRRRSARCMCFATTPVLEVGERSWRPRKKSGRRSLTSNFWRAAKRHPPVSSEHARAR